MTKPIEYARSRSPRRAYITIGVCWLLSAGVATPLVLGVNRLGVDENLQHESNQCNYNNSMFLMVSSICSFYIPCAAAFALAKCCAEH